MNFYFLIYEDTFFHDYFKLLINEIIIINAKHSALKSM